MFTARHKRSRCNKQLQRPIHCCIAHTRTNTHTHSCCTCTHRMARNRLEPFPFCFPGTLYEHGARTQGRGRAPACRNARLRQRHTSSCALGTCQQLCIPNTTGLLPRSTVQQNTAEPHAATTRANSHTLSSPRIWRQLFGGDMGNALTRQSAAIRMAPLSFAGWRAPAISQRSSNAVVVLLPLKCRSLRPDL